MQHFAKRPAGFHWQPMGSDAAPSWIEGYEQVFDWLLQKGKDESVFDSLLVSVQETLEIFKASSARKVDFTLKMNEATSTIKFLAAKLSQPDPEFKGHEGRIVLRDEDSDEVVAERVFFIIMRDGVADHVIPRAQIL